MNDSTALLIKECRSGKRSAQLAIYSAYAKKLYFACYRIVGNRAEAEEAMQDAFLKIFTRLDQFREEQNFEAWIHRIAVHTAIDYVRKQQVFLEELTDNINDPDAEEAEESGLEYSVEGIKKRYANYPPVTGSFCRFISLKDTTWKRSPQY